MDTEFFKELERFTLIVKKRVSTAYSGGRKSLRFGHGISPVSYREYRRGDDFKRWTGRSTVELRSSISGSMRRREA